MNPLLLRIAFGTFGLILLAINHTLWKEDGLSGFSIALSCIMFIVILFDIYIWKFFPVALTNRPNLNGSWQMNLQSEWIDPVTKTKIPEKTVYFVIRQNFNTLTFRLLTSESSSESVSWAIEKSKDALFSLHGTYRNEPKPEFRAKSQIHYGGINLNLDSVTQNIKGIAPKALRGTYWTDRKTIGTLVSTSFKKEHASSFEEAKTLFGDQ